MDHVSFEVNQGEVISLIGPNGAGKTTVFNMLTGVYQIDGGEIIFEDRPIHNLAPKEIVAAGISRTFQNIRLFGSMRVVENVLVGTHIRTRYSFFDSFFRTGRFRREEAKQTLKALDILDSIGLGHYVNDYASSLPYGDQRKVEIARALAISPKILLLDAPAAGMNPNETHELLLFVKKLNAEGLTVVVIEHDLKFIMNVCDHIMVLNYGQKLCEGNAQEIQNNKQVQEAYFGKRAGLGGTEG